MTIPLLFSCEHATCAIPEPWRDLFRGEEETIMSPEGWEPGSLNLAQGFAMKFRTPLVHGDVTRLLIDLDATADAQWSRFSKRLTDAQRTKLEERHARPYRELLRARVTEALKRDPLLVHIMVHTSTEDEGAVILETLGGDEAATRLANLWAKQLRSHADSLRVDTRMTGNLPAPAATLRDAFGAEVYASIVLRVSQTFFLEGQPWRWEKVKKHILDSLTASLAAFTPSPESPSSP